MKVQLWIDAFGMLTKRISMNVKHNLKHAESNLERGIGKHSDAFLVGPPSIWSRKPSKSRHKWAACPMLSILKSTIVLRILHSMCAIARNPSLRTMSTPMSLL